MADYDDSFEADSTASENSAQRTSLASSASSNSPASSSSGAAPPAQSATAAANVVQHSPSGGAPVGAVPVPVAAAAASTAAAPPKPAAVPLSIPLPVPVSDSKAPVAAPERSEQSGSPSSPPLPPPRSRAGAFTSPPTDALFATAKPMDSASGNSEQELWRRPTLYSSSKLSNSDSAGLPREVVEAAARAGDGAEFQALSHFIAFGSERASSPATTFIGQASQRNSELQLPLAPSRVPRQFVAFPASEDASFAQEQSHQNLSTGSPAEVPAALSPDKAPSDTKSASVAPSSVFSTLSQHLQAPPPQLTTAAPAASVPGRLSLPLPLAPPPPPPPATAAAASAAAVVAPLDGLGSAAATSDTGAAPSPLRASATASPNATATATNFPALPPLPSLPPPGWAASAPSPQLFSSTGASPLSYSTGAAREAAMNATQSSNPLRWGVEGEGVQQRVGSGSGGATAERHTTTEVAPLLSSHAWRHQTEEAARVSELREASEAVERLVRAFAMLKGYGALEKGERQSKVAPVTVSAATTTAHRPGAAATMQARAASRSRGPRVPTVYVDATGQDAPRGTAAAAASTGSKSAFSMRSCGVTGGARGGRDGERLAEDLVLDCVLGLLQEHAAAARRGDDASGKKDGGDTTPLSWRASRPHYEVVSADSFAVGSQRGGSGVGTTRGRVTFENSAPSSSSPFSNAFSSDGVPGIDVPLFDPRDRHSAVDLYNVAREALSKYVLRRIRTGDAPMSSPPTAPLKMAYITAAFAWTLLLDMANVCNEIARTAYDTSAASPSAVYPILVEFRGDVAYAEVARSAMHCLPFEALSTSGSSGDVAAIPSSEAATAHTCLFRMACWVTQEQLWTLSDALVDTVREDVVKRAKAVQYAPFSTAAPPGVDPRLLVPSAVPVFTMRPLPNRRQRRAATTRAMPMEVSNDEDGATGTRGAATERGTASAASRDLFDVPAAALQQAAYNISALSTTLLSSSGGNTNKDGVLVDLHAEDYADVAVAVGETINELLQDEAIKAAVQRRAAEKVRKAQMQRTGYAAATRQRKEQAIIDKAEKEAEEMVQHILQEMRAQKVAS